MIDHIVDMTHKNLRAKTHTLENPIITLKKKLKIQSMFHAKEGYFKEGNIMTKGQHSQSCFINFL